MPLGLLRPGETGEIAEIRVPAMRPRCRCRGDGSVCECGDSSGGAKHGVRVEEVGLRIGKTVEMLTNGGGPILVKVDGSRIAVARGIAMKILVRRTN